MACKLVHESSGTIPASEMASGDVGVVYDCDHEYYIGLVVKANGGFLFSLSNDDYWSNRIELSNDFKVRILPKGTLLKVV